MAMGEAFTFLHCRFFLSRGTIHETTLLLPCGVYCNTRQSVPVFGTAL